MTTLGVCVYIFILFCFKVCETLTISTSAGQNHSEQEWEGTDPRQLQEGFLWGCFLVCVFIIWFILLLLFFVFCLFVLLVSLVYFLFEFFVCFLKAFLASGIQTACSMRVISRTSSQPKPPAVLQEALAVPQHMAMVWSSPLPAPPAAQCQVSPSDHQHHWVQCHDQPADTWMHQEGAFWAQYLKPLRRNGNGQTDEHVWAKRTKTRTAH